MSKNSKNIDGKNNVKRNYTYSNKLAYKNKENKQKAQAIYEYCKEWGITLPTTRKEYKENKDLVLADRETGYILEEFDIIARAYYDLKQPINSVLAEFQDDNGNKRYQLLMSQYSRNKIDSIWNYKKSKTARRVWIEYLKEHTELIKDYEPKHLTLTVPHKNGTWRGQEFFAKELIKEFNLMRKSDKFKQYIYAGAYNIETTKTENGNHTHLHALVFQHKQYTVNKVRKLIVKDWNKRTGATQIRYESLYVHQKDNAGRWIIETKEELYHNELDADGNEIKVTHKNAYSFRKKFYLDNSNDWYRNLTDVEKIEQMSIGILETLKYNFKEEVFKNPDGTYNVSFMHETLINGKGLRFYSKFGAFYGEKKLNLKQELERDEPLTVENEQYDESQEDDYKTDTNNTIINTYNPFTYEHANLNECKLKLIQVDRLKFLRKPEKKEVILTPNKEDLIAIIDGLDLKKIAELIAKGQLNEIIKEEFTTDDTFTTDDLDVGNILNKDEFKSTNDFINAFENDFYNV